MFPKTEAEQGYAFDALDGEEDQHDVTTASGFNGDNCADEINSDDGVIGAWIRRNFTPGRAVGFLTFASFLNYMDRGIAAGASIGIKGCVYDASICPDLDLDWTGSGAKSCGQCRVCGSFCDGQIVVQTGFGINMVEFGLLQSSFMIGFICGALFFAQSATRRDRSRLMAIGMLILAIACLGSGQSNILCLLEHGTKWSYYLMLSMRALSGIGEASLSTLALPFLDDILDSKNKGFYVGIYYVAIPVGTAFGFIWAGMISSAMDGLWGWAYFLETPLILLFATVAFFVPKSLVEEYRNSSRARRESTLVARSGRLNFQARPLNFCENVIPVLSQPAYLFGVASYAIYTGVVAGIAVYGPTLLIYFNSTDDRWGFTQAKADILFGLIASIGGFIGTVLGGYMLDLVKVAPGGKRNRDQLLLNLALQTTAGFVVCLIGLYCESPYAVLFFLFIGCAILFMISAGINLLLLWSVPYENRAMSSALSVLLTHLFGDVPSPILIGIVSDATSVRTAMKVSVLALIFSVFALLIIYFCIPERSFVENLDDEHEACIEEES